MQPKIVPRRFIKIRERYIGQNGDLITSRIETIINIRFILSIDIDSSDNTNIKMVSGRNLNISTSELKEKMPELFHGEQP
jgi:hypothetical protein